MVERAVLRQLKIDGRFQVCKQDGGWTDTGTLILSRRKAGEYKTREKDENQIFVSLKVVINRESGLVRSVFTVFSHMTWLTTLVGKTLFMTVNIRRTAWIICPWRENEDMKRNFFRDLWSYCAALFESLKVVMSLWESHQFGHHHVACRAPLTLHCCQD